MSRTCLLLAFCLLCFAEVSAEVQQPLTPDEAQQAFVINPECRIELVACEPDVIDPVHIAFAPDGKLWVVEYSDYPNGPAEGEPGRSRIRVLTDADGDGRYDNPVTFAEGLIFANGLMHWKDGVIVTTNGQVLFMRDTDGDGRCDDTQQWFTGFATENPQLRCNHPTFGPDNRIYIANGLRGGKIIPGSGYPWLDKKLPEPLDISGRDFRFDPFTGEYEAISGNGQFGLTFDDWGNRFVCSNRNPCNHIVLEEEHLKRAPYMRVAKVFEEVSPAGEKSKLYPISRTWTTSNLHANQFTAACGVTIYRGNALPESFYGNSFTCEPTANLVHCDVLTPVGVTFTSKPEREGIEFLATTDEWFRPVNLAHGPDDALYVVDMYRAVIEHPQFVPDELKNRPDQLLGTDKGRIWRVVAKNSQSDQLELKRVSRDTDALISVIADGNFWQRETARRLLTELQDPEINARMQDEIGNLAKAAGELIRKQSPLANPGDTVEISDIALKFQMIMAERHLHLGFPAGRFPDHQDSSSQPIREWLLDHLNDESEANISTPWAALMLQSTFGDHPLGYCQLLLSHGDSHGLLRDAAAAVGRKNDAAEISSLLQSERLWNPATAGDTWAICLGLSEGMPGGRVAFRKSLATIGDGFQEKFDDFVTESRRHIFVSNLPTLIALAALAADSESLIFLADDEQRLTAYDGDLIRALAQRPEPEAGMAIARRVPILSVANRNLAVQSLLGTKLNIKLLLDMIEAGTIPALSIDPNIAKRLMTHADPVIREKADRLLKQEPPEDRVKVLAEYASSLTLASDPLRGKQVFVKNCATCHKIGDVGVDVAPDISDSRTKTPEYLLTNILDPNRAIDNNFFSYTVVNKQGVVYTGIMASETGTAITLKQPEGKVVSIGREDIEEMKNNGVSLMPVGLEKTVPPQDMADVISFIKNWRYLDGSVPKEVIR